MLPWAVSQPSVGQLHPRQFLHTREVTEAEREQAAQSCARHRWVVAIHAGAGGPSNRQVLQRLVRHRVQRLHRDRAARDVRNQHVARHRRAMGRSVLVGSQNEFGIPAGLPAQSQRHAFLGDTHDVGQHHSQHSKSGGRHPELWPPSTDLPRRGGQMGQRVLRGHHALHPKRVHHPEGRAGRLSIATGIGQDAGCQPPAAVRRHHGSVLPPQDLPSEQVDPSCVGICVRHPTEQP
mmetsp:Transcript_8592/g.23209  ORF Transcript_8592/g.23209 Transcript_8592/m.23209 type:complete len:235 (+) Transcript_8592:544-1248(+)